MKMKRNIHRLSAHNCSAGFTLVEMLVAVGLVLLMMSLFASVFVNATSVLSTQRGIAENDQRARRLSVALRDDLEGRTFRDVLPFRANEDTTQSTYPPSRRAGYFEINEGNPYDNTDDVLQFTVSVNLPTPDANPVGFVGKAPSTSSIQYNLTSGTTTITLSGFTPGGTAYSSLYTTLVAPGSYVWIGGSRYLVKSVSSTAGITLSSAPPASGFVILSEYQPDYDDGFFANGVGSSSVAEVCYFMRNGNLYRRALMIRENLLGDNAQPSWSTGTNIFWTNNVGDTYFGNTSNYPQSTYTSLTGAALSSQTTFWNDFDYSAFYYLGKTLVKSGGPGGTTTNVGEGVYFNGASDSLSNSVSGDTLVYYENETTSPVQLLTYPVSLGHPAFRFGHNSTYGSATFGCPQQISCWNVAGTNGVAPGGFFANRFILQECANPNFGYPGYIPLSGNPYNRTDLSADSSGLVSQYDTTTSRRGEDILLANVLSFDVKVWDPNPKILAFVDVGDTTVLNGSFTPNAQAYYDRDGNQVAGALNAPNALVSTTNAATYPNSVCFDTWHPNVLLGTNVTNVQDPPYVLGMPTPNVNWASGVTVPTPSNGTTATIGQPQPLQAIQITVNYRDVSSGQIRQVTFVESLTDRVIPTGE